MALILEAVGNSATSSEFQVLSDEQIDELLKEAEARLKQKAGLVSAEFADNEDVLSLETTAPVSVKRMRLPKLEHHLETSSYLNKQNGLVKANADLMVPVEQRQMSESLRTVQKESIDSEKVNDQKDAGQRWFNLPKTELTASLKRDLQLIEMRNVLDPHRHYKKSTRKGKVPTFSQVGTVIEGPTEWYSGRINKKDRSKNFVEEEMRNEAKSGRFKRKYNEIQDAKTSGKKAHYAKVMSKRRGRG